MHLIQYVNWKLLSLLLKKDARSKITGTREDAHSLLTVTPKYSSSSWVTRLLIPLAPPKKLPLFVSLFKKKPLFLFQ